MKKRILSIMLMLGMVTMQGHGIVANAGQSQEVNDVENLNIAEGLQAWYRFDETDGMIAHDSSGNGHDAQLVGNAQWVVTNEGEGVALDIDNTTAVNTYVDVPVAVMENVPDDFTVSLWVKVEEAATWSRIFDYGTRTSDVMFLTARSYQFKMDNDNAKAIELPKNGTVKAHMAGCPESVLWPTSFSTPRWQHVTVTRKGDVSTLWVNGIKWARKSYETRNARVGEDYKFYIGKSAWEEDSYPNMEIMDFRLYNRALSINEINAVINDSTLTDQAQVHYAIDSIVLGDFDNVTSNLYLPTKVNDKVDVSWSCDSEYLIAEESIGAVVRPEVGEDAQVVTLTATFSYGDYEENVDYDVCILPKEETDARYTLNVDTINPLHAMSPTMYGLFFEDLSMAGDGGMYAELLRNTCFHDSTTSIPYWHMYNSEGAEGSMSLDNTNNLNDVQFQHLKLSVTNMPENGYVGIRNEGYNGMEFEVGKDYTLTFFARTDNFEGKISAMLISATGEQISEKMSVEAINNEWTQYTLVLNTKEYAAQGEFVLMCEGGTGDVYLDVVSLFPETYKDHNLREDMVDVLVDLSPTFLRFPGGCYVEGRLMADAFRWKNTLYGKENRAGHDSLWNYRVTDGLGYYEFLVLCEDLGVEPMYVCGIGIAHEENEDWAYWVQDVLDAIEFANGDVDTKWGAVRAEMGHPEPFNMKYVEIGNEAHFQYKLYEPRYQDFYDAIKEKYPYMNLIADCNIPGKSIDMVDEHIYKPSEYFIENAYRYDSYDRESYEIYVGEYAVNCYHGNQNLHAALGEAAFMTGMERNSDIVKMTSYSELFANLNHQNWNATAAFFDSSRLYGTPSFYAQKMFGEKLGDVVLETTFTSSDDSLNSDIRGGIGLGTWNSDVTFTDIKVTSNTDGSVLFDGNSSTMEDWQAGDGEWSVENGIVNQTEIAGDCRLWIDNTEWSDYTYEVTAKKNSGSEGFLLMVGHQDSDNFYYLNFGGWNNSRSAIEKTTNGVKSAVSEGSPDVINTNEEYKVKVVVQDNTIKAYVNDTVAFDYTCMGNPNCPLYYVSQRDNETGEIILKVVNTSDNDYSVNVVLDGAENVADTAEATIMTSHTRYDENSFENPTNVAPVTIPVYNTGNDFDFTFMKNSITILTLNADVPAADKTELEKELEKERPDERDYTEESWSRYTDALAEGELVLANPDATQLEINQALENITDAKALLVFEEKIIEIPEILASFTFDEEIAEGEGFDGINAVATGSYSTVERDGGKALKLDGAGQFLNVVKNDGTSLMTQVNEFTVTYLAKPDRATNYNWGFFTASNASNQIFQQEKYIGLLDQSGTLRAERFFGGVRPQVANAKTNTDGWYHVSLVCTPTESVIYLNGEEVAREESAYTPSQILGRESIFQIGKANWGAGEFFAGTIDNMNVYGRALTPTEILMEAYNHIEIASPEIVLEAVYKEDNTITGVRIRSTKDVEESVAVIVATYEGTALKSVRKKGPYTELKAGDKDILLETPITYSENETVKVFIWTGGDDGSWFDPVSEPYVLNEAKNVSE